MVLVNRDCLNPRPHMVLLQENHAIPSALRLMGIIHVLLKGYHFCIHSNVNFIQNIHFNQQHDYSSLCPAA